MRQACNYLGLFESAGNAEEVILLSGLFARIPGWSFFLLSWSVFSNTIEVDFSPIIGWSPKNYNGLTRTRGSFIPLGFQTKKRNKTCNLVRFQDNLCCCKRKHELRLLVWSLDQPKKHSKKPSCRIYQRRMHLKRDSPHQTAKTQFLSIEVLCFPSGTANTRRFECCRFNHKRRTITLTP